MDRKFILLGSFFALVAVILGAMGAHALKGVLSMEQLNSFNTAVTYQMYHGLALIAISSTQFLTPKSKKVVLYLIGVGVVIFSGSIYLLVGAPIFEMNLGFLGPITPVGGLLLISAWIFIIITVLRYKPYNN